MDAVNRVLSNPILRQGLKVVAPELALGINLIASLFSSRKRTPSAKRLLAIIDERLAKSLEVLATSKSKHMRKECETRAHELLGVLNEWDKNK